MTCNFKKVSENPSVFMDTSSKKRCDCEIAQNKIKLFNHCLIVIFS